MTAQTLQEMALSRSAVLGIASGILFMTFFGAIWGFTSAAFMSGVFQIGAFLLVGLVTLGFFAMGGLLICYARSLSKTVSPEDAATGKRTSKWFGIVFGTEIMLIALASIVLPIFQLDRFIPPATALIVGMHFFPLARLFRVSLYSITGTLLSVLALVALVALLLGLQIDGPSPYNWSLFVGVGATLVLWLTTFSITRYGLRFMRHSVIV
ncbi:MAG TPA: hypothetical protein VKR42_06360 [Ktedonobacteraceae bacterium]|nr:hypothetical protein [Ktedonobacteraceae bacterium]